MTKRHPFVSILIVNYNGRHLLHDCLTSVFASSYPSKYFEVILYDNDSQDGSVEFVKKYFSQVKVLAGDNNIGFAAGNNEAYREAKGEYIVLLNNDTVVDKNWLEMLVIAAKKEKNVGIVNSKLLFSIPFVELTLQSEISLMSDVYGLDDYSPLGLIIENIEGTSEMSTELVHYSSGVYDINSKGNYPSRWTNGSAKIMLPYIVGENNTFSIILHGQPHTAESVTKFAIYIGGTLHLTDEIQSKKVKEITITLNDLNTKNSFIWLVQNAGNVVFKNGQSRDRGAVVKMSTSTISEFYDFNSDYYDRNVSLTAACAASILIKREAISDSGMLFDANYFMYYEDIDLSLRIKRMGWIIRFEPGSIVYHKHKASTKKQGDIFFSSMVAKNHLLLLIKHFPYRIWMAKLFNFSLKMISIVLIMKLFKHIGYYGKYYRIYNREADSRLLAFNGIKKSFRSTYSERQRLQENQRVSFSEIWKELY